MEHVLVGNLGVGKVFKEAFVLIDCNFSFISEPKGSKRVNNLAIKLDWV